MKELHNTPSLLTLHGFRLELSSYLCTCDWVCSGYCVSLKTFTAVIFFMRWSTRGLYCMIEVAYIADQTIKSMPLKAKKQHFVFTNSDVVT